MNYLLKSSSFEDRKRSVKKKLFIVIGILLVGAIILTLSPVRNTLFFIAEPVWKVKNSIVNSSFFEYFKTKQRLIDERTAIERELFLAGDLLALNETLKKENETLKDLLGRQDTKLKTVLTSVLAKPPQLPYDSLLIDIGEDQGIKVGDQVIANANVYIGEVSEVLPHSAKVSLYSTPGRKLSVVLGVSAVTAEAVGIGGGNFNILLPREVEVKEGDVIVTPAITSNVFGIVEKVNFQDKDSAQTILFKSPVNVSELSFVEVVID
jgi:cell shape-determining protein MreC